MTAAAALFEAPHDDKPQPLASDLLAVIRDQAAAAPRSRQRSIGPSEVGQPCDRRLALQLLGAPEQNTTRDSWPATVGTATHAWLADALIADNARLIAAGKPPRWLVEQRVNVRTGLSGSCDAYDLHTRTVIDWKVVGTTALKKYRNGGPGQQYRAQAHLYGVGWRNAGLEVDQVAIVFLPRAGMLPDTYFWSEPFNPELAQGALDRMDQLLVYMNVVDVDTHPEAMRALTRVTDMCGFCPFWTPDRGISPVDGCNGDLEDAPKPPARAGSGTATAAPHPFTAPSTS